MIAELLLTASIFAIPIVAADRLNKTERAAQLPIWLQSSDTPSVAVAVIEQGKLQWTAVAGDQAAKIPASPDTLYNVASLTKPITAELLLRLASAEKSVLDTPLTAICLDPDLKIDPQDSQLTARRGLLHQCGRPNWRRDTDGHAI